MEDPGDPWHRLNAALVSFVLLQPSGALCLQPEQASRLLEGLIPFLVKALAKPASHGGNSLMAKRKKKMDKASARLPEAEMTAKMVARDTTEAEVLRVLCRLMEVTSEVTSHLG